MHIYTILICIGAPGKWIFIQPRPNFPVNGQTRSHPIITFNSFVLKVNQHAHQHTHMAISN